MCMEMFDAASVETRVVNDQYPFFLQFQFANQFCVTFLEFCSLKAQLHQMKQMLHQRPYMSEICHTLWNDLICMCISFNFLCWFYCVISCLIILISLFSGKIFSKIVEKLLIFVSIQTAKGNLKAMHMFSLQQQMQHKR